MTSRPIPFPINNMRRERGPSPQGLRKVLAASGTFLVVLAASWVPHTDFPEPPCPPRPLPLESLWDCSHDKHVVLPVTGRPTACPGESGCRMGREVICEKLLAGGQAEGAAFCLEPFRAEWPASSSSVPQHPVPQTMACLEFHWGFAFSLQCSPLKIPYTHTHTHARSSLECRSQVCKQKPLGIHSRCGVKFSS